MLPTALLEAMAERIGASLGLSFSPDHYPDLSRKLEQMAAARGSRPAETVAQLLALPWGEAETTRLAQALTVKETYFCRELQVFRALRDRALPELVRDRAAGDRAVRCWCAACATGEEAWSTAMLLWAALPVPETWQVRIAATDIDPAALAVAGTGRYTRWSFRNVPAGVVDRFFLSRPDGTYLVAPALQPWVEFSRQNLVADPAPAPAGGPGFDLVVCRNVLIYFTPGAIRTAVDRLVGALRDGGWLAVGVTETPFVEHPALVPVRSAGVTLFRKREAAAEADRPPRRAAPRRRRTFPSRSRPAPSRQPAAPPAREPPPPPPDVPGDLGAALASVEAGLEADRLDPRLLYLRAAILDEQGRAAEAEEAMRRVVYADPSCIMALYRLGLWALRAGRVREARRYLREARERCSALPGDAPVPGGAGLCAARLLTLIDDTFTTSGPST